MPSEPALYWAAPQTTAKELTLNGRTFDQFVLERSMAYVSQRDVHIAELTVRESLDFSALQLTQTVHRPGHWVGAVE